jgi:uncharacterized protein YjbI with pentapeptide repeats
MVVSKTEGIMVETGRENWVDWIQKRWLDWLVSLVLLFLFILAVRGSTAAYAGHFFPTSWQPWWDGFLQNSGTEMLGAFLTFILLEVIRGRRERKAQEKAEERRTEDLKALQRSVGKQLQEQMRRFVQAQEIARLWAAKTLEERQPILAGMKATGLLRGANLRNADLQGANLYKADLRGANLEGANLQEAGLEGANLQKAGLEGANLQGANLKKANLQGANLFSVSLQGRPPTKLNLQITNLEGVNLERAILRGANLTLVNLQEANLEEANLQGANLEGANLQGTNLKKANLQEANLFSVNLQGARWLAVWQLRQVETLERATLPDGITLPGRTPIEVRDSLPEASWREAFETWYEVVETVLVPWGERFIKPADLPPVNPDDDG